MQTLLTRLTRAVRRTRGAMIRLFREAKDNIRSEHHFSIHRHQLRGKNIPFISSNIVNTIINNIFFDIVIYAKLRKPFVSNSSNCQQQGHLIYYSGCYNGYYNGYIAMLQWLYCNGYYNGNIKIVITMVT